MATLRKVDLFIPRLLCCRHRSKVNTKKPRPGHLDRRVFEAITVPLLQRELEPVSKACPKLRRQLLKQDSVQAQDNEVNEYEQFLVRDCRRVLEENPMVVFFQPMSMSGRDRWELWAKLHKKDLHLHTFGNKILGLTIEGTKWQNLQPLLAGPNVCISSPQINVSKLVKETQKVTQLAMLGGVVDDRILTRAGLLQYADLPHIDSVRGELAAILGSVAGKTRSLLTRHQEGLTRTLDQHVQGPQS